MYYVHVINLHRPVAYVNVHAKADCCPLFKTALIESVGKQLVECTQDLYWASGLPPRFIESTKPDFYPGKNHLGHVLESVRKDLVKEAVQPEGCIIFCILCFR